MKIKGKRKGFTLIEIMLGISIVGLLAALGIPAILRAYSNAQEKAKVNNIASVEKAKGVLTLPDGIGMPGAMGLKKTDAFDDELVTSNMCKALRINDISELTVGSIPITIGDLTTKAYYE
jgi:prepilin-type N-terminal cleavage/methylation domain-containing protein